MGAFWLLCKQIKFFLFSMPPSAYINLFATAATSMMLPTLCVCMCVLHCCPLLYLPLPLLPCHMPLECAGLASVRLPGSHTWYVPCPAEWLWQPFLGLLCLGPVFGAIALIIIRFKHPVNMVCSGCVEHDKCFVLIRRLYLSWLDTKWSCIERKDEGKTERKRDKEKGREREW